MTAFQRRTGLRWLLQWFLLAIVCLVGVGIVAELSRTVVRSFEKPIRGVSRALIVTAHPDDESLFFPASILSLRRHHREVHILCFTTGNFHGLGEARVEELHKAAAALQVNEEHLVVVNDSRIPDGKQERWPIQLMSQVIAAEVRRRHIDTVVTFDPKGVYGHVNHAACQEAVRYYADLCRRTAVVGEGSCPSTWQLVTERARKYLGAITVVQTAASCWRTRDACYVNPSLLRTIRAMSFHASQWRWWGHLFTTPYAFVNSLDQIHSTVPADQLQGLPRTAAAPAQSFTGSPPFRLRYSARKARALHNGSS